MVTNTTVVSDCPVPAAGARGRSARPAGRRDPGRGGV